MHNETLKAELEKVSHDKDDLKETHKNYMIQMQTLINQKSIEAPGVKKMVEVLVTGSKYNI